MYGFIATFVQIGCICCLFCFERVLYLSPLVRSSIHNFDFYFLQYKLDAGYGPVGFSIQRSSEESTEYNLVSKKYHFSVYSCYSFSVGCIIEFIFQSLLLYYWYIFKNHSGPKISWFAYVWMNGFYNYFLRYIFR